MGLKVEPLTLRRKVKRSEVEMADLDPRANTDDQMEPLGETKSFGIKRKEGQITSIGSELMKEQAKLIDKALKRNNDLFA